MKIIRFSKDGFKIQEQKHHMEKINYELYDYSNKDIPNHLRTYCEEIHYRNVKFYKEHYKDFEKGIWCFVEGHKSNLALNHLKEKVPCWEAEIDDNAECYDCNFSKLTTVTDSSIFYGGFYLPEREIYKIFNVKRRCKLMENSVNKLQNMLEEATIPCYMQVKCIKIRDKVPNQINIDSVYYIDPMTLFDDGFDWYVKVYRKKDKESLIGILNINHFTRYL